MYELTNHLGNVLATVSDRRNVISTNDSSVDHYEADVVNATDYYAFGMEMPGRVYKGGTYRYGFNGKENDNEVKGEGNQQDYGMRIYDPRLGRFLSVDPLTKDYSFFTPYQFAGNKPTVAIDLDGAEDWMANQKFQLQQRVAALELKSANHIFQQTIIKAYNPSDRTWTQKWRDSKNILAKATYSMANGLYTFPQQLTAGVRNEKFISNIGGNAYHAYGRDEDKRRKNFVDFASVIVPGGESESAGSKILNSILDRFFTKFENQVTQQVTDRGSLFAELVRNGVKFTEQDIMHVGRDQTGKVIFLEKGNLNAGYEHILNHADEFENIGIAKTDIADVVFEAATKGKKVGVQGNRPIYEVMYKGEAKNIAVTVSDNGFIVGANPTTKIK